MNGPEMVYLFARHALSARMEALEEVRGITSGSIIGMTLGDEGTPEYGEAFKAGWASAMDLVRSLIPTGAV